MIVRMATVDTLKIALSMLGDPPSGSPTKVELAAKLKQAAEKQLVQAIHDDVRFISRKVAETDNAELKLLAEAMLHQVVLEKPKTEKLGYALASRDAGANKIPKNDDEEKLLRRVLSYLDLSSYIFSHTHYDECSNGYYFRRS